MISGSNNTPDAVGGAGVDRLDAAAVLASARRARVTAQAAEAKLLAEAVAWAHLHTVEELEDAATWWDGSATMGRDTGIPIAGEGCPLVAESAVVEFATAVGLPQHAGRQLLGQALELAHRLPKTWARVVAGSLPAWRARRIAEATTDLSLDAVGFVDAQVAPYAHKTGPAQTQRLLEVAIATYMPAYAAQRRQQAAEQRHATVEHDQVSFTGTVRIHAETDLVDGLDLEDALQAGAHQLATLGCTDPLDVRRAKALGMIARGETFLPLDTSSETETSTSTNTSTGTETSAETSAETGASKRRGKRGRGKRGREVVLVVHLSEEAIRSGDPNLPALVEAGGPQLITTGQVAEWCGLPETSKVTVKPLIDLNTPLSSPGYQPSERVEEHVKLRDRTCVFPYCHRAATHADLDHNVPYDPAGPDDQTSTENLAVLCRLHHRMKTHCGWTYTMIEPGIFHWRSPYGYAYRRDRTGTTDLTPNPVEPPDPPPDH